MLQAWSLAPQEGLKRVFWIGIWIWVPPTPTLTVTAVPRDLSNLLLCHHRLGMQGDTAVPLMASLEVTAPWPTSVGFLCPLQIGLVSLWHVPPLCPPWSHLKDSGLQMSSLSSSLPCGDPGAHSEGPVWVGRFVNPSVCSGLRILPVTSTLWVLPKHCLKYLK